MYVRIFPEYSDKKNSEEKKPQLFHFALFTSANIDVAPIFPPFFAPFLSINHVKDNNNNDTNNS